MLHDAAPGTPAPLFGAFDRHNFGDQLFPRRLAAQATDQPNCTHLFIDSVYLYPSIPAA